MLTAYYTTRPQRCKLYLIQDGSIVHNKIIWIGSSCACMEPAVLNGSSRYRPPSRVSRFARLSRRSGRVDLYFTITQGINQYGPKYKNFFTNFLLNSQMCQAAVLQEQSQAKIAKQVTEVHQVEVSTTSKRPNDRHRNQIICDIRSNNSNLIKSN